MNAYYLTTPGRIERKDNSINIRVGEQNRYLPIERVSDLYILCEMDFNTSLLNFLGKKGVCVHIYDYYNNFRGSFYPKEFLRSGELLIRQVEHYTDNVKRVFLAKEFILGSFHNMLRNLKYYNRRGINLKSNISNINALSNHLEGCNNVKELMGYEGNARREYYDAFDNIIVQDLKFKRRTKRPPKGLINVLISFINSLLYTRIIREIYHTQLNPTISYLHEPGTKRYSLSLDVSEIFKPLIVDRIIFSILNKKIITEKDLDRNTLNLRLKEESVKKIIMNFEETLSRTIKHRKLNRHVSYERMIRLELYKIIKHLFEDEEYSSFKMWW